MNEPGDLDIRWSLLVLHHQPTFLPFPPSKDPPHLLVILCYPVVCLSFGRKSAKRSIYSWQLHNLPDNRAARKVNDQYMQSIEPAKMNHRSRCEQAIRSLLAPSLQSTIAIRKQSPYSGVGEGGKGCPYTIAPELIIHSLWWQFSVLSFFWGRIGRFAEKHCIACLVALCESKKLVTVKQFKQMRNERLLVPFQSVFALSEEQLAYPESLLLDVEQSLSPSSLITNGLLRLPFFLLYRCCSSSLFLEKSISLHSPTPLYGGGGDRLLYGSSANPRHIHNEK